MSRRQRRARLLRRWRAALVRERAAWRRHDGTACVLALFGWLALLWGVVWLAERAGMY